MNLVMCDESAMNSAGTENLKTFIITVHVVYLQNFVYLKLLCICKLLCVNFTFRDSLVEVIRFNFTFSGYLMQTLFLLIVRLLYELYK